MRQSVASTLGLGLPIGRPTDQALEMGINRPVALAAAVPEALNIEDMDATLSLIHI